MQIQGTELESCKFKYHYIADVEKVEAKKKEALKLLRSTAKIPGFRPGKAPDWAIEAKMKPSIENWMKQNLVDEAYQDILFEQNLKVVGQPHLEHVELYKSEFWCDLIIHTRPVFELKQYKGWDIPKPPASPVDDIAQKTLQELRSRYGDFIPYEEGDFVQAGDKITMSLEAFEDDVKVEKLSEEGMLYQLGQNMYPEFDDNLIGMAPDELRVFRIKFGPEHIEELRDKTIKFAVKVHMGLKINLVPLDDTLAIKVGFKDFATLNAQVLGMANARAQQAEQEAIKQQIIKRLLAENPFEAPEVYSNLEAQNLARQHAKNPWESLSDEEQGFWKKHGQEAVRLSFILEAIREVEPETVFSEQEMLNVVKNRAQASGQNPEKFLETAAKNGQLVGFLANLKTEAVMNWIQKNCKIVE